MSGLPHQSRILTALPEHAPKWASTLSHQNSRQPTLGCTLPANKEQSFMMPKPTASKAPKAASSKTKAISSGAASNSAPPPTWPVLKLPPPQVRLTYLEPESLLDARVLLLRNFWPKPLCKDYVSFLRSLPLTTTPGRPKRGEAARINDRFQVHDPGFAHRLWTETGLSDVLLREDWNTLWLVALVARLGPLLRCERKKQHTRKSDELTRCPGVAKLSGSRPTYAFIGTRLHNSSMPIVSTVQ